MQQVIYRAGGGPNNTAGAPVRGARGGARGRGRGRGGRGGTNGAAGEMGDQPTTAFVRGGSARGRGRGRGGATVGDGSTNLELSGLPQGTDYASIVAFLNAHAPKGFRFIRLQVNGTTARMTVQAAEVSGLMATLTGQQIAPGFPLAVALGSAAGRPLSAAERQSLTSLVRSSFEATGKVLDLASLAQKGNFQFVNFHSNNFTSELFNIIQQVAPDAVSINLANNGIQTLACFLGMIRAVPMLKNLSLQNNLIANVDQFEHLAGYREKLRELLLTNNPFFISFTSSPGAPPQTATQLDYSVYQQYLSSIFPSLQMLDGQTMQSLIDFDLPQALSSTAQVALPPVKDSYFDSAGHQKVALAFVQRYFELYDRNRQDRDLCSVYADNACFSLSYQTEPRFANAKYTEQNRNIQIMGSAKLRAEKEISLLKSTPIAIVGALHALPPSKHDINSLVADVFKVPSASAQLNAAGGLLNITIRGQFLETDTLLRCFHRTFLCTGPSPDALAKQWPVSILHDALYIGAGKVNAAVKAAAAAAAAAAAPSTPQQPPAGPMVALGSPAQPSGLPPLTAQDQQMILALCQQTGIDANTATQLLVACQGDMNKAMEQVAIMRSQQR